MLFSSNHSIRPRSLRESVTLYDRVSATDEFGVQSLSQGGGADTPVGTYPASVEKASGYVKMNYYQSADVEAYVIRLRYVAQHFNQVVWGGVVLSVDDVEDEGQRHRWMRVTASRRAVV